MKPIDTKDGRSGADEAVASRRKNAEQYRSGGKGSRASSQTESPRTDGKSEAEVSHNSRTSRRDGEQSQSKSTRTPAQSRGGSRSAAASSSAGSRPASARPGSPRLAPKRISKVSNFKDFYKLGGEVMPSTHSYIRVHFGKRIQDGEEVVIKIRLKPNCFRSSEDEKSWRRRQEALLNLPMPDYVGICKFFEVLEDNEGFYIVMERVEGVDLYEMLDTERSLSLETVREILRQILVSVHHFHVHNMVHKDLKLENVMINAGLKGRKKEKDKGRARSRDSPATDSFIKVIDFDTLDEWTPKTPSSKDVVGTDQYISQEAYAGKYSPLSDMFAVGVIAYKLLSGKFPFDEKTFIDTAGENYAGSPAMNVIRRRLKVSSIDFYTHPVFKENPSVLDLVSKMLSFNEQQRPTAFVALEHPFFKDGSSVLPCIRGDDDEELIDDDIIIGNPI